MSVIRFHLPDEAEAALRARGIDPAGLARELVLREVRGHEVEATLAVLARHSKPPSRPVVDTVRDARGTR